MSDDRTQGERALGGWLVLAVRQGLLTLITLVGVVVLGRLLGPADFAVYGYATLGVTLALAVGDLGLASRVIREELTPTMLRRVFGAQLVGLLGIGLCVAGTLPVWPLAAEDRTVGALVLLATLLAALQTLPTALLERRLAFRSISQIEVGQRAIFTALAIALAVAGTGDVSIPVSAVAAGIAGYAAAILSSRWKIRPAFRGLLETFRGFGSEWWQGRLAAHSAYAAYPLLGGLLFEAREVGYIVLALTITSFSTLLAPLVARATFPTMAASQTMDRVPIFRTVFRAFAVLSLPVLALTFVCAREIVSIGFGDEWEGAVGVLRMTCVATVFGVALTPSLPLLYLALDPRYVKRVLVGWAAIQWGVTPLAALLVGIYAPAAAGALAGAVALFLLDRRLARVSGYMLTGEIRRPLIGALVGSGAGLIVITTLDGAAVPLLAIAVTLAIYALPLRGGQWSLKPRELLDALFESSRNRDRSQVATGPKSD